MFRSEKKNVWTPLYNELEPLAVFGKFQNAQSTALVIMICLLERFKREGYDRLSYVCILRAFFSKISELFSPKDLNSPLQKT